MRKTSTIIILTASLLVVSSAATAAPKGASSLLSSGDQVWTNESGVIHPTSTNAVKLYPWGGLLIGTNTESNYGPLERYHSLLSYHFESLGDDEENSLEIGSVTDPTYGGQSTIYILARTNMAVLSHYAANDRGVFTANLITGPSINQFTLTSPGDGKTFRVSDGDVEAASLTITRSTNQITFGATNTPPQNTAAPTKWISVLINGEPTQYRIPLHE